ncbi:MAG: DUF4407 domain-containing protein [Desulfuromonadales bacterium]|nr:DUF4407 domain-containing protein [Desulfuromonadales bacterium]
MKKDNLKQHPKNSASGHDGSKANRSTNEAFEYYLTKLNWLERLLLFMSKTELFILQYCTRSTRMTLTSVGAMVVITGILAFFSSFFAVKNSFFMADKTFMSWLVPIFVACVYSGSIMAFDREIVSATDKRAAWMRIPFAILIGIVISYPIELQMQHGRITAEINKIADSRNKDKKDDIKKFEANNTILMEQSIKPLLNKQDSLKKLRDQEQKSADWESQPQNGLCRGKCAEHKTNAEGYQRQLDEITGQIQAESKRIDGDKRYLDNKKEISKVEEEIEADKNRSHDLLSQAVALHSIYKSEAGGAAETLGWFLRFFFVCFELFPVLIKMTMSYTEYHAYLDARMRLNVNKMIGASNHKLEFFRDNPDKILFDNTEITDMLAMVAEDREIDTMNRPEDERHG